MPPRKLTPQTPGEPIRENKFDEQPAAQDEQAPVEATETAPDAETPADPEPVAARRPSELPHAAEIDPKTLQQPVLTKQGYVVPEK